MDATNVAILETPLYHGLSVEEGRHVVDIMECDNSFIRTVINDRHGVAGDARRAGKLFSLFLKVGRPRITAALRRPGSGNPGTVRRRG